MYREHYASREAVEHVPFLIYCEAAGDQEFTLVACGEGFFGEVVAPLITIAHLELAEDGIGEASFAEIGKTYSHTLVAVEEVLSELPGGVLRHNENALALILFGQLLGGDLTLLYLYMVLFGQPAERLRVREVLMLHDEVDGIPTLATTETLEYPLGRGNGEGGGFLIVERTQSQQVDPSSLQRNELGNDLGYLRRVKDPFYGGVVNHGRINVLKKVLVMNTGRCNTL